MAIGTLVLVASTWLAGTSASYASVNRVNVQLTMGTSPWPGHDELVQLTEGSKDIPLEECPGSYVNDIESCPLLDGNTRVTPNHDYHKLYCNAMTDHENLKEVMTSSFLACVDACSMEEGCVGAGWNKSSSICSLKTEYITDEYPITPNTDVDSSSEQCPSFDPEEGTCPSVNGKICCDFGEQFKIFCNLAVMTPTLEQVDAETLGSCIEQCAAMPRCTGADYDRSTKHCYTKYAYLANPTQQDTRLDGFVMVQRRR
ncbi:MAG: hypothetical protein M1815_001257 [Lichina confinis]|nr:MAG: hypothetical protein M1815_001257 [Lichina confinis]